MHARGRALSAAPDNMRCESSSFVIDSAPRVAHRPSRASKICAPPWIFASCTRAHCRLSPTLRAARWYDAGVFKSYVSITPLWLRLGLVAAATGATLYIAIEDRQPFRAIWLFFSSYQLGYLITWLLLLLPCLAFIYALAALMHRRRRKADFPTARIHER